MKHEDYHDYMIISVRYQISFNYLILELESENHKQYFLQFENVAGWDLSEFKMQNIIFDFNKYDFKKLSTPLIEDYEITDHYLNLIKNEGYFLFEINSSVGMGGYIVSKDMKVVPSV